jgi:phosphotriesterase-related protein
LECTPSYIGRDARLLRRLSNAVGIEIWTNTGLYGAANHRYVPAFAREESAEQLARRWIAETRNGIDGVKPRFIKTGVNRGPLHEMDHKLVRAAALCSRETGLTIASHTGDGKAALEQIEILSAAGVKASKLVWVHAQNEKDHSIHERAARAGAWVEFDGIGPKSADWHLECVRSMSEKGLIGSVLISQDAGWYHVGEPGGGTYRGYTYLYTDFAPRLDARWVKPLLVDNPERAFG